MALVVVHPVHPTMKLPAYSAAYGYSNHSPKIICTRGVPYTTRPINAKIPSGVPPQDWDRLYSTCDCERLICRTQPSIFSKTVKSVTRVGLRSSSTARQKSTAPIVGKPTRFQKTEVRTEHSSMSFDNMEDQELCVFCGMSVQFFEDDWMRGTGCGAEFSNMDYTGDHLIEDWK